MTCLLLHQFLWRWNENVGTYNVEFLLGYKMVAISEIMYHLNFNTPSTPSKLIVSNTTSIIVKYIKFQNHSKNNTRWVSYSVEPWKNYSETSNPGSVWLVWMQQERRQYCINWSWEKMFALFRRLDLMLKKLCFKTWIWPFGILVVKRQSGQ